MESLSTQATEYLRRIYDIKKHDEYIKSDKYVLDVMQGAKDILYSQIHGYLANLHTNASETEIRNYVKEIIINILPLFEMKLRVLQRDIDKLSNGKKPNDITKQKIAEKTDLWKKYFVLYDDFYALSAFRSLEHFALYMDWDLPDNKKIWKYNLNCFHGFWYYANQMVLNGTWRKIEKQCPTGYGKSYSDIVLIAFILGYDINADIMKVCGNPQLVSEFPLKLLKYMLEQRYAKVFPYYAQFNCDPNLMFDTCQKGGNNAPAKFAIHGSKNALSFIMANKDTPIDGVRYKWRFYDDITRSKDKGKIEMHEKDIKMYDDDWSQRQYDDYSDFEIFSGTTYHIEDILSTVKRRFGIKEAIQSKVNKYTKINTKTKAIFVCVPKLDPETDESTFPQKYSTENAREKRAVDPETFAAMNMQEPLPQKGCPFAIEELQTYDTIPEIEDAQKCCWAALDPARTGANYVAMCIHQKVGDFHYLKDALFDLQNIKKMHSRIVDKVIQHHITRLHIENNTDTSLKTLLLKLLAERGVFYCDITEIYSSRKKEDKIHDNEVSIKKFVKFPRYDSYARGSQMGQYMKYLTSFSYLYKNLFDDSVDVEAMYCAKFIDSTREMNKVKILDRRK